jgi:hypothetical protein
MSIIPFLLTSIPSSSARAQSSGPRYHSSVNGYTVDFPAGWIQMNRQTLQRAGPKSGRITWELGYEDPRAPVKGFPYAVVQIQPYATGREMTQGEIVKDLKNLHRGVFMEMDTTSAAMMKQALNNANSGNTVYDPAAHIACVTVTPKSTGIKALATVHYGRRAMIWVICYDRAGDLDKRREMFDAMHGSFKFDNDAAYDTSRERIKLMAVAGLVVAVLAGVVILIIFLNRSGGQRRPATAMPPPLPSPMGRPL